MDGITISPDNFFDPIVHTNVDGCRYLRVSTQEQDTEKNKADILKFANDRKFGNVEFVEERVSGTVSWRNRKIKTVIDELCADDRLIVPEISRLGRSMLEIMEMLSIAKERGISVYAVKGPWELNGSIQSKVMAMVFSMVSEIERDLISSRTKEGLRHAKASGKQLGRPKGPGKSKLDQFKPEIQALLDNGTTKTFIARRYKTTLPNLFNWMKKNAVRQTKPL
jgi:DNA invertase Pin-like site-specific DNA recombinase